VEGKYICIREESNSCNSQMNSVYGCGQLICPLVIDQNEAGMEFVFGGGGAQPVSLPSSATVQDVDCRLSIYSTFNTAM